MRVCMIPILLVACVPAAVGWKEPASWWSKNSLKSDGGVHFGRSLEEDSDYPICEFFEENNSLGLYCFSCSEFDDGIVELDDCSYDCMTCSDDFSSCGYITFSVNYTDPVDPFVLSQSQTFQYDGRGGRSESISFDTFDCDRNYNCGGCRAYVNSTQCNNCEPSNSDDGFCQGFVVDCENVVPDSSFDYCVAPPGPGVFQALDYSEVECFDAPSTTPPSNDVCSRAEFVSNGNSAFGNLDGALNNDLVAPFCFENEFWNDNDDAMENENGNGNENNDDDDDGLDSSRAGIWYTFEGTGNPMLVSTCTEEFYSETLVSVYEGLDCESLNCIGGTYQDTSCSGFYTGGSSVSLQTDSGVLYYVFVSAKYGFGEGGFMLSVVEYPGGGDGSCSDSGTRDLEVDGNSAFGSIDFRTDSTSVVPVDCGAFDFADAQAWFQFEPAVTGTLRASTCSFFTSGFKSGITILAGSCERLFCVAESDLFIFREGCGESETGSTVDFEVTSGTTYYLSVRGGFPIADIGLFELTLRSLNPPANDMCEDAKLIPGDKHSFEGVLIDATSSEDEQDVNCSGYGTTDGIWYSFEGSGEAMRAASCSNDFEHIISIYKGSCGSLECLAPGGFNFNSECDVYSSTSLLTESGTMYYILVSAIRGEGSFTLSLTPFERAENDNCDQATQIFPDSELIVGNTANAIPSGTDEFNGSNTNIDESSGYCYSSGSPSMWYVIVGTGGVLRANTCSDITNFDTTITAYRGICGNFICLETDDDGCGTLSSAISFQSEPFVNYYIRVQGLSDGSTGDFGLTVSSIEAAENDQCDGAIGLTLDESVAGSMDGATSTNDDDFCAFSSNFPSIWYSYIGAGSAVNVSTCSRETFSYGNIRVLTGACGDLTCETIGSNDVSCSARFFAEKGVEYYIQYSGENDQTFTLSISEFEPPDADTCETAKFIRNVFASNITGSTQNALSDTNLCNFGSSSSGVWYSFNGTGQVVAVSTCSDILSFDSALSVYVGGCDAQECLAYDVYSGGYCGLGYSAARTVISTQVGVEHHILVHGAYPEALGDFSLTFSEVEVPSNDVCSGATSMRPDERPIFGSTVDATDSGAVECNSFGDSPDLWYEVEGTNTELTASLCGGGTSFDSQLSIYQKRGESCDSFCVTANDDFCGASSEVQWFAAASTTYLIRVHGFSDLSGVFELSLSDGGGGVDGGGSFINDECDSATLLDSFAAFQTNRGDTFLASNPVPSGSCGTAGFGDSPDVWYSIEGNDQEMTVSTCMEGTSFDTVLAVYTGSCFAPMCLDGIDDDLRCEDGQSRLSFYGFAGETYYIRVSGFSSGSYGPFELSVSQQAGGGEGEIPDNDVCDTATSLAIGETILAATSEGATYSGEMACFGASESASPDLWYRVEGTGETLVASTCGNTNFDSQLSIYGSSLESCTSLECIAGNDDACLSTTSETRWSSTRGDTYFVRVHGFESNSGSFELSLTTLAEGGAASDSCEDAVLLFLFSDIIGSTTLATPDPLLTWCGEATSVVSNGVWYTIIGDGGRFLASTCNEVTNFDTQISIFTGDCTRGAAIAMMECVDGNDQSCGSGDQSQVEWDTLPGETYYILVHGYLTSMGVFQLTIVPISEENDQGKDNDNNGNDF